MHAIFISETTLILAIRLSNKVRPPHNMTEILRRIRGQNLSVTNENRRLRDYLRKRLIYLADMTGGNVSERRASGGRVISDYKWENKFGKHSFRIIWHNSVSDRYFSKTINSEIKRNLRPVIDLFEENETEQNKFIRAAESAGIQHSLAAPGTYLVAVLFSELDEAEQTFSYQSIMNTFVRWKYWRKRRTDFEWIELVESETY